MTEIKTQLSKDMVWWIKTIISPNLWVGGGGLKVWPLIDKTLPTNSF